jgi:hypothetical protein
MSFEDGYGGEKGMLKPKRPRLRDHELIAIRSNQMYAQRLAGWKMAEVARLFRITREHASRQIAAIPETKKAVIRRKYHSGQLLVARSSGAQEPA